MNLKDKVEVRCFRDKDEEWWEEAEVIVLPHNDDSIGVRFLTTQGVNRRRLAWVAKEDWRSCASVIAQPIYGAKTHERSNGSDIGPDEESAGVEQSDRFDAVCASRAQPLARALDPSERAAGGLDAIRRAGIEATDDGPREHEGTTEVAPVYADILAERERQDAKWGGAEHDDNEHTADDWGIFIERQVRDISRTFSNKHNRERLVKIAALAVAAIESIDRGAEK